MCTMAAIPRNSTIAVIIAVSCILIVGKGHQGYSRNAWYINGSTSGHKYYTGCTLLSPCFTATVSPQSSRKYREKIILKFHSIFWSAWIAIPSCARFSSTYRRDIEATILCCPERGLSKPLDRKISSSCPAAISAAYPCFWTLLSHPPCYIALYNPVRCCHCCIWCLCTTGRHIVQRMQMCRETSHRVRFHVV